MDKEMMDALAKDAAMLEAMGAGEQSLEFWHRSGASMVLIDAAKGLWSVIDPDGVTAGVNLTRQMAESMISEQYT